MRKKRIISATADSADETETIGSSPRRLSWTTLLIVGLLTLGALGAGLKYLEESAKQEKAKNANKSNFDKSEPSLLSKLNPFVEPTSPTPTPQLSKEYIYAGSRMLAVEDKNANAAPPADLAVWRPSTGYWYVLGGVAGSQQTFFQWGGIDDKPVPGDYDGDGKTDFAVRRPSATSGGAATWFVSYSSGGNFQVNFGLNGDQPAPADYDGDGKTDIAVFRSSNGKWYVHNSSNGNIVERQFGINSDVPVAADFDGDGRADIAVWRTTDYKFYIYRSSDQTLQIVTYGAANDQPVCADYDGDGRADLAIRRADGTWHIAKSSTNFTQMMYVQWQQFSDTAVPNDYDGDGVVDIAVWRPGNGTWYIRQSSRVGQTNELRQVAWGQQDDFPVPAFYRR